MSQRKFLVIADDSPESGAALRYACKRALSTGGHVCLLRVIEPAVFEHWSGVREEMERQERVEAESVLQKLAETVVAVTGPSLLYAVMAVLLAVATVIAWRAYRALLRELDAQERRT